MPMNVEDHESAQKRPSRRRRMESRADHTGARPLFGHIEEISPLPPSSISEALQVRLREATIPFGRAQRSVGW